MKVGITLLRKTLDTGPAPERLGVRSVCPFVRPGYQATTPHAP